MNSSVSGLDTLLARYVTGDVPEPVRVMLQAHLELSGKNRGFVRDLEALGGAMLEGLEPAPVGDRDKRLAEIFAQDQERPVPAPADTQADPVLPAALVHYLGHGLDGVRWRSQLPGLKVCAVDNPDGVEANLYWIRAGTAMPHHTHEGSEITLVLKGAFSDVTGHYARGDLSVADETVDHRPRAGEGEDCICFAVIDAPLRLTGPIGRFLNPFLKQ